MGHQRLGKLPAYRLLPDIIKYLVSGGVPTADLVQQVTVFTQTALTAALKDPGFNEALWLLVRIPEAAGTSNFAQALQDLGLPVTGPPLLPDLLVAYDKALEKVQRHAQSDLTDLGQMGRHAALAALAETVQDRLPGLWAPTPEDVRASVSRLQDPVQFAAMAHLFYAKFIERSVHYFIDRDLHRLVGQGRTVKSIYDLAWFETAIRRHCHEAAMIMRGFARDWLAKQRYGSKKAIKRPDMLNFSSYAVQKLRNELSARIGLT